VSSGWPVIDSVRPPVPHNPRDSPISHTTSPSPFPSPVPYPDRLHKQELSPPCIPSSPLPTRKNSHSRRRDPGHIPRPRNAFIFFRSHFIAHNSSLGAGQQNELSKSAAKEWNQMTETEKRPFAELAAKEKREHTAKYPNYTYAPGRTKTKAKAPGGARKMTGSSSSSSHKRRRSTTSSIHIPDDWSNSATSPESFSEEFSYPTPPPPRMYRAPRAAAQRAVQRLAELPSPAPSYGLAPTPDDYTMSVDGFVPRVASASPDPNSEFVPTSAIPPLELTPLMRKVLISFIIFPRILADLDLFFFRRRNLPNQNLTSARLFPMSISCLNSLASNPMFLMKPPTPGSLPCPEPTSRHRPSFILMDNTIFLRFIRRSPNILPRSLSCRHLELSLARMISAISHRLRTAVAAAASRILSVRMGRCWRGRRRCKGIWWRATGGSILILILSLLRLRIGWLDVIAFFFFLYILFLSLSLSVILSSHLSYILFLCFSVSAILPSHPSYFPISSYITFTKTK
jgi:hypothetical protein